MNLKSLIFFTIFLFTACGGGSTSIDSDTGIKLAEYEGKKTAAELTAENYKKIVQSLHYLFDDNELNDNELLDSVVDGRVVTQNISNRTGLGTVNYTYDNFQIKDSEEVWSGSIKLNIVDVNRATGVVKINAIYNLNIEKFDDELSIFIRTNSTVDTKLEIESTVVKEYRLKSKKDKLDTEIVDFDYNGFLLKKARIYIASEGYIDFSLTSSGYEMFDASHLKTVVKYSDKEILLTGKVEKKLYYKKSRVASSPFPTIMYAHIELKNIITDTNLTVTHETNNSTFTHEHTKWYVNGNKTNNTDKTKLSRKYFKKGDKVKVVFALYNNDACSVKVIERYEVQNSEPIITIIKNHNDPYNDASFIQTDTLEFPLNSFDIYDADGDSVDLRWSISDYYRGKGEILAGTDRLEHPIVSLSDYGIISFTVEIEEENGYTYSDEIWLDVRTDIFKTDIYTYSQFREKLFANVKVVSIADMNGDGLKDMVIMIENDDIEGGEKLRRVEVFYQDTNYNFMAPKVFSVRSTDFTNKASLILNDIDGDGLMDISISYREDRYHSGVVVYKQTHTGTFIESFTQVLGNSISSLISTDFNNDGKLDFVALTNESGTQEGKLTMDFLKQDNEGFSLNSTIDTAEFTFDSQMKLGDFNGDKKEDVLVISNDGGAKLQIYLNSSTGKKIYEISTKINNKYIGYNAIVINDFNGDGYDDIIFGVGLSYAALNLNRFEDIQNDIYVSYSSGSSGILNDPVLLNIKVEGDYEVLKIADINGDGQKDILIYKNQNMTAYLNDNGVYTKYPRSMFVNDIYDLSSNHISVTDMDNDGLDDVVIAPDYNELLVGISKL